MDLFDIVIPLGLNDLSVIKEQLSHTKKNVVGFRTVLRSFINIHKHL